MTLNKKKSWPKVKLTVVLLLPNFAVIWKVIKNSAEFMPQKATLIHISPTKLKKLIQYGLHNIILNAHIQENIMYGKNHLPEKLMV